MSSGESVINALTQAIRNATWEGDVVRVSTEAARIIVDVLKGQDWISTKDGLPSRNKVYLITLKTPEGPPQVMEAYLDYGGTWWRGNVSLINEYVTHWMLLPKAPKEMIRDENC